MFADAIVDAKSIPGLVITGAFGVLSTLIPLIDAWLQRKGERRQAEAEIDLAAKQVAFWKGWLEALTGLSDAESVKMRAIALDSMVVIAKRQTARAEAALLHPRAMEHRQRPFLARLFLLYTPRYVAWLPRIMYYALSLEFLYGFFNILRDNAPIDRWTVLAAVLNLALIMVFRLAAIQIEESRRRSASETKSVDLSGE